MKFYKFVKIRFKNGCFCNYFISSHVNLKNIFNQGNQIAVAAAAVVYQGLIEEHDVRFTGQEPLFLQTYLIIGVIIPSFKF